MNTKAAKKIKVEAFHGTHFHAGCMLCTFATGIHTDETPAAQDVRAAVYKHVRETGHECWIESGTTWHYSLTESQP